MAPSFTLIGRYTEGTIYETPCGLSKPNFGINIRELGGKWWLSSINPLTETRWWPGKLEPRSFGLTSIDRCMLFKTQTLGRLQNYEYKNLE